MKRILSLIGVILVMGCGSEGPPDDGPYEFYWENGQLMIEGDFQGTESGTDRMSSTTRTVSYSKGTMKDGVGPVESYYDNGELSYKGTYKDDGVW